ncbi:MAG: TlpA family protein disulfide reductase [Planctomycetes bacterium]|nr:TlpA family protein disulfide reductase [Planctomycetota bacterium]
MKRLCVLIFGLAFLFPASGSLWAQADFLYQKPPEIQGKAWLNTKKSLTLKKLKRKKKVVILEFMITTCPHCVPLVPRMKEIYEKYSKKDVVLIAVTHENAKKVAKWVKEKGIPYPVLSDPDTKTAGAYSNTIAPYIYIIGKNGLVCWQNAAQALNDDELDIALAAARATKEKK